MEFVCRQLNDIDFGPYFAVGRWVEDDAACRPEHFDSDGQPRKYWCWFEDFNDRAEAERCAKYLNAYH